MLKALKYGFYVFKISWQAYGYWTVFFVIKQVYEGTIYPFIQIFLLSRLIDILTLRPAGNLYLELGILAMVYIISSIVRRVFVNINLVQDRISNYKLNDYLRLQITKKLVTLDPATFESTKFQSLLTQMDTSRENIVDYLQFLIGYINSISRVLVAALVLVKTFWIFIPVLIISSLPLAKSLNKFRFAILPFMMETRANVRRVLDYVKDLLSLDSTSKEIAIFKNGDELISKIEKHNFRYFNDFEKIIGKQTKTIIYSDILHLFVLTGIQAYNLLAVLTNKITVGQFSLYFQQALNLSGGILDLLNTHSALSIRFKYIERYLEFLNYKKIIEDINNPLEIPSTPFPAVIEFKNVTFRYPDTDRDILKNFNLTINSHEKVALVGENGAGKTTLIKLLLRFYDVNEGEIIINGVNLKEISLEKWHQQIGALFQDFIKYQFTFKENIIFGDYKKRNDAEALKSAIYKSGSASFLDELKGGYEQVLGKMFDDGVNLSGGQWQKVALARAFFRDAPILILDEPTSAIDAKSEAEIFEKVQKLQNEKTVIIISHRFSTVRNADRILVLDGGKIIEEGSHKQLMKEKGIYAELFELQAQGYK